MKNAKNVKSAINKPHFLQIDRQVEHVSSVRGVLVLPSPEAWKKFIWTRKIFRKRPSEGYFVWVKEQVDFPLSTCVTLASRGVSQNLNNLMVVERGLKVKANVLCHAKTKYLHGIHRAKGKLLLKEGASLDYNHLHSWGQEDFVNPDYEFFLEKNAKLDYSYKNIHPPKALEFETKIHCAKGALVNMSLVINSLDSKVKVKDFIFLEEEGSQGVLRMRLVGQKKGDIDAVSQIFAKAPSKGHLDCQGLMVDRTAKISLTPKIICENKEAQLTHEASIGRVSEEELIYLRMRGLSEKEAIDLIVSGFLEI